MQVVQPRQQRCAGRKRRGLWNHDSNQDQPRRQIPQGPQGIMAVAPPPNHPPPTPAQLDRAEQISRGRAPLRTVTLSGPIAAEILRESSSWRGYDSMTVWDKLPEALVHRASLNGFQTRLSNSFIELNIYYYIVCSLSLVTIFFLVITYITHDIAVTRCHGQLLTICPVIIHVTPPGMFQSSLSHILMMVVSLVYMLICWRAIYNL